jgi:hypothetical protein
MVYAIAAVVFLPPLIGEGLVTVQPVHILKFGSANR